MLSEIISPRKVFKSFFPRTKYISSDKIISQIFFGQRNIFRPTKYFSSDKIFLCGFKSFSSDEKYFCGLKIYFSFSKVVPRGFGGTKVAPKTAWNHTTNGPLWIDSDASFLKEISKLKNLTDVPCEI